MTPKYLIFTGGVVSAFGAQRRNGDDPILDCLTRVENIPKPVQRKVVDRIDWTTTRGYLEHLDTLPLGPNVVPLVPHSMLRIEVMGTQAAVTREPTQVELDRMRELCPAGTVIGVNLGTGTPVKGNFDFGPSLSGWQALFERLSPLGKVKAPNLLTIISGLVDRVIERSGVGVEGSGLLVMALWLYFACGAGLGAAFAHSREAKGKLTLQGLVGSSFGVRFQTD